MSEESFRNPSASGVGLQTASTRRCLRVEVVGAAASGKSTLLRNLMGGELDVKRGWRFRHPWIVLELLRAVFRETRTWWESLGPGSSVDHFAKRCLLAPEMQTEMVLMGRTPKADWLILDQGLIYSLTFIKVFGNLEPDSRGHQILLDSQELWSKYLAGIIWPDADDSKIRERLNNRSQKHRMDSQDAEGIDSFVARYRVAFAEVIDAFVTISHVPILRIQTDQVGSDAVCNDAIRCFGELQQGDQNVG